MACEDPGVSLRTIILPSAEGDLECTTAVRMIKINSTKRSERTPSDPYRLMSLILYSLGYTSALTKTRSVSARALAAVNMCM